MDRGIEKFPVEKRQIRFDEPPALIFFDVDEESDEAEFIRVDDLFAAELKKETKLTGWLAFTLFPFHAGSIINSSLARVIYRSLLITGIRLEHPAEMIRVRPLFAQWMIELKDDEEPELFAREFRADLEDLIHEFENLDDDERFWADHCFVCTDENRFSDEMIVKAAESYQKYSE